MNQITIKQKQFNVAMKKYNQNNYYKNIYFLVSLINVTLQMILLVKLFTISLPWYIYILGLFIAYFITDFINGLVHMYMDNNDNYNSIWGPFIASFHLHHKTQKYKDANLLKIYFNESGAKFWLVIYLLAILFLSFLNTNSFIMFVLILVGVLSSIAEISHYLCHNNSSKLVLFLQDIGILLSMKHHTNHHQYNNRSYAFLNGKSDFLIDFIAQKLYSGYVDGTDKHFENYYGEGTCNR